MTRKAMWDITDFGGSCSCIDLWLWVMTVTATTTTVVAAAAAITTAIMNTTITSTICAFALLIIYYSLIICMLTDLLFVVQMFCPAVPRSSASRVKIHNSELPNYRGIATRLVAYFGWQFFMLLLARVIDCLSACLPRLGSYLINQVFQIHRPQFQPSKTIKTSSNVNVKCKFI